MSCYNIKTQHYKNCLFDKIDATYVLIMDNSTRIKQIQGQLDSFKPTNIVHIQYNKGYKKCHKTSHHNTSKTIDTTYDDLTHAYIQAFKHAKNEGYNYVMILEDDCVFSENLRKYDNIEAINNFLPLMSKNEYILSLGCLPFITLPYSKYVRKSIISLGSHCQIYSKEFIDKFIDNMINEKVDGDIDIYFYKHCTKYIFKEPLAYQLYEKTENSNNWGKQFGYFFSWISLYALSIIKWFKMDKYYEPGTSIIYKNNIFIFDFILPILFGLLILHIIHTCIVS